MPSSRRRGSVAFGERARQVRNVSDLDGVDGIELLRRLRDSTFPGSAAALISADHGAEVALGDILFRGQQVPRQPARGLMWLTLGRDCVGADQPWIKPLYDNAFHRASDDERAVALVYLEDWLKGRRE